jgi:hypothetical protein
MSGNNFDNRNTIYPTSGNPRFANTLYLAPPGVRFRNFARQNTYDLVWGKNLDIAASGSNGLGSGGNWGRTTNGFRSYNNNGITGNAGVLMTLYPNVNDNYQWRVKSNSPSGNVDTILGTNRTSLPTFALNLGSNLALYNANAIPTSTTLDRDTVPEDGNVQPTILRLNYLFLRGNVQSSVVGTIANVTLANFRYNGFPTTFVGNQTISFVNTSSVTFNTRSLYLPVATPSGNTNIGFNIRPNRGIDFSTSTVNNNVDFYFGIATPIYSNICLEDNTLVEMSDGTEKEIGQIYESESVKLDNGETDIVVKNLETRHKRKIKMVYFKKDSISTNIPYKDTFATSGHKIKLPNGNIYKARDLVNGGNIKYKNKYIECVNSLVLTNDDHFYLAHGMPCKSHTLRYKSNNIIDNYNFVNNYSTIQEALVTSDSD